MSFSLLTDQLKYDIIIAGAGCSGLSLLLRMLKSDKFHDKKILLIDRDQVKTNDRTWCFWEQSPGFFEHLVYRQWSHLGFYGERYEATLDISPYSYKMIRGVDFYAWCFAEINKYPQVDKLFGDIRGIEKINEKIIITVGDRQFDAGNAIVFNSILKEDKPSKREITVLQHFKGWVIETDKTIFNPSRATLMDFRVDQQYGTGFVYVLPLKEHAALVEYTLFTPSLLRDQQYDEMLNSYINQYINAGSFRVTEHESGVIPMTNRVFPFYENGVYHIGTAGGQTKASTGYTFRFIQKQSAEIVDALINGKSLTGIRPEPARFRFYDNTLLHILYHNSLPAKTIFSTLFRKNEVKRVLRFLDNESSCKDEWKIISSLPTWPFLRAAVAGNF